MGVGKSMKIFMEAMQGSMLDSRYGGKIVNTRMGPFQWDDLQEMWVNPNNGFRMPNISMQDLLSIGSEGYDYVEVLAVQPNQGGSPPPSSCSDVIPNYGTRNITTFVSTSVAYAPNTTFTPTLTCSPDIYVTDEVGIATHEIRWDYTVNSGTTYTNFTTRPASYSNPTYITFPQGGVFGSTVRFKVYKKTTAYWLNPGKYDFYIKNRADNSTIYTVSVTTANPV